MAARALVVVLAMGWGIRRGNPFLGFIGALVGLIIVEFVCRQC